MIFFYILLIIYYIFLNYNLKKIQYREEDVKTISSFTFYKKKDKIEYKLNKCNINSIYYSFSNYDNDGNTCININENIIFTDSTNKKRIIFKNNKNEGYVINKSQIINSEYRCFENTIKQYSLRFHSFNNNNLLFSIFCVCRDYMRKSIQNLNECTEYQPFKIMDRYRDTTTSFTLENITNNNNPLYDENKIKINVGTVINPCKYDRFHDEFITDNSDVFLASYNNISFCVSKSPHYVTLQYTDDYLFNNGGILPNGVIRISENKYNNDVKYPFMMESNLYHSASNSFLNLYGYKLNKLLLDKKIQNLLNYNLFTHPKYPFQIPADEVSSIDNIIIYNAHSISENVYDIFNLNNMPKSIPLIFNNSENLIIGFCPFLNFGKDMMQINCSTNDDSYFYETSSLIYQKNENNLSDNTRSIFWTGILCFDIINSNNNITVITYPLIFDMFNFDLHEKYRNYVKLIENNFIYKEDKKKKMYVFLEKEDVSIKDTLKDMSKKIIGLQNNKIGSEIIQLLKINIKNIDNYLDRNLQNELVAKENIFPLPGFLFDLYFKNTD